jgi:hypothetical protein
MDNVVVPFGIPQAELGTLGGALNRDPSPTRCEVLNGHNLWYVQC